MLNNRHLRSKNGDIVISSRGGQELIIFNKSLLQWLEFKQLSYHPGSSKNSPSLIIMKN
jgi:hypothetical protein